MKVNQCKPSKKPACSKLCLPHSVKGVAISTLYADDTSFLFPNTDPEKVDQNVKVVLEIIKKWFNSNRMLLNYKTNFIQFSPNTSYLILDTKEFNTHNINSVNSIKFLSIIIDSSLTWKVHVGTSHSAKQTVSTPTVLVANRQS
jgi:hypothetical protein